MLFTAEEQSSAEELIVVLKDLKTATTIIYEQHSPSISIIPPVLSNLKRSLTIQENNSALVKAVKTAALQNLNTHYLDNDLNRHLNACTILDPRYKDMPMDEDSHSVVKTLIIDSAVAMPDQTSVLSVPVKNENETKTATAEVFPALPSLPPALTELTLKPKVEKLKKIEITVDEIDIPAKKLKAEPECFLDD